MQFYLPLKASSAQVKGSFMPQTQRMWSAGWSRREETPILGLARNGAKALDALTLVKKMYNLQHTLPGGHPLDEILCDPLQEDAHRSRRSLLALSSMCLAVWWIGKFPQQISALGITFSNSDEHNVIWAAIWFQTYLFLTFFMSASTDYLRWRRKLKDKITMYGEQYSLFEADVEVESVTDKYGPLDRSTIRRNLYLFLNSLRLEAPDARIKTELQAYANGHQSLYAVLFHIYPPTVAHHVWLLILPVVLYMISVGVLYAWS
jgi:hypothetical protein